MTYSINIHYIIYNTHTYIYKSYNILYFNIEISCSALFCSPERLRRVLPSRAAPPAEGLGWLGFWGMQGLCTCRMKPVEVSAPPSPNPWPLQTQALNPLSWSWRSTPQTVPDPHIPPRQWWSVSSLRWWWSSSGWSAAEALEASDQEKGWRLCF